ALFYEVLFNMSHRVEWFVVLGCVVGCVVLAVVAYLILRAGKRLPIKTFISAAISIIILLSIAFAGKAVQSLQASGVVNATLLLAVIPRLPRPLADFTGIHPTLETILAQIALACVYIAGGAIMWWKQHGRLTLPKSSVPPANKAEMKT